MKVDIWVEGVKQKRCTVNIPKAEYEEFKTMINYLNNYMNNYNENCGGYIP